MASTILEQDTKLVPPGTLPAIHTVYRDPKRSTKWTTTRPQKVEPPAENEASAQYALVTRYTVNYLSPSRDLDLHSIAVQSQALKATIHRILDGYTGITPQIEKLEFDAPFEPFVRRWDRLLEIRNEYLAKSATAEDDQIIQAHLELLYLALYKELAPVLDEKRDLLKYGLMTHKLVWSIFEPGRLVYMSEDGHDRLYKLNTISHGDSGCTLECDYVDFDGKIFGTRKMSISIPRYEGTKKITTLEAYPMEFHKSPETLCHTLLDRGRRFELYTGSHLVAYEGIALETSGRHGTKFNVNSRIIVDSAAKARYTARAIVEPFDEALPGSKHGTTQRPNRGKDGQGVDEDCVDLGTPYNSAKTNAGKRPKVDPEVESALTTEQLLIANSKVRGYSLRDKKWFEFFVDSLQDIVWNDEAFTSLVAPPDQKELILAFTEAQAKNRTQFDDFIQGKGKGVIMLLAGPAGVGKTLTAESVAENMRVPLYTLGAAELGSQAEELERRLQEILELCTKWNAVLLLDEADVFMEARGVDSLERNKLVAVFLRLLEYFEGIMFLTTNRIESMDAAFESRIHLSINYVELDKASRRQIWSTFLDRISKTNHGPAFTEAEIDKLSRTSLNGRQIKNVLKTGQLLADRYEEPLNMSHLETVLRLRKSNERKSAGFFGGE